MKKGLFPVFYILISIIFNLFIFSYVYADDVLPPIITIFGISESQYYSTAVYPEISISDINLAYSTVTLKLNTSADSAYVSGTEIKKDGKYRLSASAFDSAGNASYESVNFTIDKTKSAISITGVSDNAYYSTDVWFKVKISETNPVKENITLDGATCPENETVWVKDEGNHKLVVYTLDKAGNSNLKSCAFTINKTSPVILSHKPSDIDLRIKEGEKIDFEVSVLDPDNNIIKLTWYLDSSVVCEGNYVWTYFAGYDDSGKHEVKFIVADSSFAVENAWNIEVEDVAVRPPLNLIAKTGTGGCVFLKWDENKYFNLLGYNIYRDNSKINKTLVTKNNYLDTGLVDGKEYIYFVRAVNINGKESINSNEALAVPEDSFAPSSPVNLVVDNNGLLSWDPPEAEDSDLAGYYLYQGVDSNNLDKKIFVRACLPVRQAGNHTPSHQLNNLSPGIQYYFAVSACDNHNRESEKSNMVSFLFTDIKSPSQVKGLRIRDTGKTGELKIKWQENSDPDLSGYKIYYGLNSSEYNTPLFVGRNEKYVLSGLNDFTKYFVAVSGIDTQGNEGLKSFEEIGIPRVNSTFIPGPDVLIIDPINKGVKLSWNLVPGADGYKVYFGRSEDFVIAPLITSDTTFIFNNLSNSNKYFTAVSSFIGKDESERVSGIVLPKDVSAPDTPNGLTCLSGINGTSLFLSWSLNKEWDLSGYKIAYKTNQEYFNDPIIIGKTNRFELIGLTEGEQYTIALFAFDTENNTSNPSIITGVPLKTNYIYKDPPSAPMLDISCENGSIRLNWTSSGENIDEYRIYRKEAEGLKYNKIYQTKNLTYKNLAVKEGRTYYYVVAAVRGGSFPEESIFSNEVVMRPRLKLGDIEMEGDVPVENRVDGYDLIMLSISFGSRIGDDYYNPNADLNGDGVIDGIDLSILANNFGKQY
ncbi:MAG: fibronectin type III domain-containing protein [bacterium]|nr:fibronectin type III domain-containing protein [bacterium]